MRLSLRVVVVGGVILGLLIPMSVATVYSSSKQRSQLMEEAKAVHARVTDVLALGVSKAL